MADLPETIEWTPGIYQLETSDPVLAGPEGIDNLQAKQLASRTRWLKDQIDKILAGVITIGVALKLATARKISVTGAATGSATFDGSADAAIAITLADTGVNAGEYPKVVINAKGLVTGGKALVASDIPGLDWAKITTGKPTTLAGYGINDAAPLASPALAGTPTAPTPARFDVSTNLATMAALQARGFQYSRFVSFSGTLLGNVSHVGGVVHCSGATTGSYSLPDSSANNLPLGANVRVQNWGATNLGLAVQGSDKMQENIDGTSSATTRLIPPDSYVDCLYIGTGLWLLTGTGVQGKTRLFGSSLGASGWQRLPSGLILQWGQTAVATGSDVTTTLPIAFPSAFSSVVVTQGYTAGSNSIGYAGASPVSQSSFVWRATGTNNGHNYLAIGF